MQRDLSTESNINVKQTSQLTEVVSVFHDSITVDLYAGGL